ncbi:MAG: hypothetical protein K0R65_2255 [Crocinitomicaceae bacterium]|jgi:gliding motility-associated lipoprotein GldD|nr:hypothetical protein [Crocinitomicaceae bacterium]
MKNQNRIKTLLILILTPVLILFAACGEENSIPKPPTYLRLDLPKHSYTKYSDKNCRYSFEAASIFKIKDVYDQDKKLTCNKDIDLGALNGVMYFSYIEMNEPLGTYIDYAINKVDEHKIKATAIEDELIIRSKDRVFGTFFELQGDVATPFQFYLTDSVSKFVSGVVYLNATPKYDSLKPSLEYLRKDLNHFVQTFQW